MAKPCYFVVKDIPEHVERIKEDAPDAEFLYRRSGFQFFVRKEPSGGNEAEPDDGNKAEVE